MIRAERPLDKLNNRTLLKHRATITLVVLIHEYFQTFKGDFKTFDWS